MTSEWWTIPIAFSPPLLAVIVGWWLSSRQEALRRATEALQADRRQIYMACISPTIRLWAGTKNPQENKKALAEITSFEYRRTLSELTLIGSDDVVQALNTYMQYLYRHPTDAEPLKILTLWGEVLLAIRRDLGNKGTKLETADMFKNLITDIDRYLK